MQFLQKFWKQFVDWVSFSKVPASPQPYEPLSRFLFSSEHFAESKTLVKYKAFMPDTRGETSIFRVCGLTESAIWNIGHTIRDRPAKARGDIKVLDAQSAGLQVAPAIEEHPRHAVLLGWPAVKHQRLHIATQLSSRAILQIPPR